MMVRTAAATSIGVSLTGTGGKKEGSGGHGRSGSHCDAGMKGAGRRTLIVEDGSSTAREVVVEEGP